MAQDAVQSVWYSESKNVFVFSDPMPDRVQIVIVVRPHASRRAQAQKDERQYVGRSSLRFTNNGSSQEPDIPSYVCALSIEGRQRAAKWIISSPKATFANQICELFGTYPTKTALRLSYEF